MSNIARHGAGRPVPESSDLSAARQAEMVKGSPAMLKVLEREVNGLPRIPDAGVHHDGKRVEPERIAAIIQSERMPGRSYSEVRDAIRQRLGQELGIDAGDDRAAVVALYDTVVPSRSPRQVVSDLLSSAKRLRASGDGILTPAEQAAIKRQRTNLADVPWSLSDLPLLDAADELLNGPLSKEEMYGHIVVDEAQDLSPMQLRVLRRRLRAGGALTILGDLAQATRGWANDSWAAHLQEGGIEVQESSVRSLHAGYRVPKVQMEYANQLLPVIDISTPETTSILELDEPPRVAQLRADDDVISHVVAAIRRLLTEGESRQSIGVIGLEELLDELQVELDDQGLPSQWGDTSKEGHVTLVTADDAKGLEFDHTLVLRPEQIYRLDPITGPRTLYVALTRARRSLHLAHVDALPTALTGVKSAAERHAPDAVAMPERPSDSGAAGTQRWMVSTDGGSILVEWVVQGPASVSQFGRDGGAPSVVAEGFAVGNNESLQWAMRTASGRVFTVATVGKDPDAIGSAVLEALEIAEAD